MSYREYARQKNLQLRAIQRRIEVGTISQNAIIPPQSERNPGKHPKIDSDIADADYEKNADPVKRAHAESVQAQLRAQHPKKEVLKKSETELLRQTPTTFAPKPEIVKETIGEQKDVPVVKEPPIENGISRLTQAKSISEELRSRKIELEVLELEGRLVDVNEVKERLESKIIEVRSSILSAGDTVALQIIGKKDLLEIKTIIRTALNNALSELQKLNED